MITLSASKLKLYRECRYQYYDRYVRKVSQTTQDTSGIFGTALHKGIEAHYTGNNTQGVFQSYLRNELARLHDIGATINYRMSYADMIDLGSRILKSIPLDTFTPITVNNQPAVEVPFTLPFYDICTMCGIIDMVAETPNGITVVDWKSASRKPTSKALNDDPQFFLYAWVFFQEYGNLPDQVIWYHLRTQEQVVFSLENFWSRFDRVIETAREIVHDDFSDMDLDTRCSHCAPWCNRNSV